MLCIFYNISCIGYFRIIYEDWRLYEYYTGHFGCFNIMSAMYLIEKIGL